MRRTVTRCEGQPRDAKAGHAMRRPVTQFGCWSRGAEASAMRRPVTQCEGRSRNSDAGHAVQRPATRCEGRSRNADAGHAMRRSATMRGIKVPDLSTEVESCFRKMPSCLYRRRGNPRVGRCEEGFREMQGNRDAVVNLIYIL